MKPRFPCDSRPGTSLYDEEGAAIVPEIMKKAQEKGVTIQLPEDYVCGDKFDAEADTKDADDKTGRQFWIAV